MTLKQTSLSQTLKIDSVLETLRVARKFQTDKLTYGLNRVHLYVYDVEGDWLENWNDQPTNLRMSESNSKPNSESENKAYTESPDDVMTLCSNPKGMTPQERYEFWRRTKPMPNKTKVDSDITTAS